MKKYISRVLYILIVLLCITFVVKTILDYSNYTQANSAPFYVFILVNAIVYLFPSIVAYVIARILTSKKEK